TPGYAKVNGAKAVLKLSFSTFSNKLTFADIKPEKIRLYLKGQSQHVNPLYELLLKDGLALVMHIPATGESIFLNNNSIQSVGFGIDDALLPYPPASFVGYRLLTEYFLFPEKFMFIDIVNLIQFMPATAGHQIEIYIYLTTTNIELEHNISKDMFVLGATPGINLFPLRADPIKLDHLNSEFQIEPESRRPKSYEVYSVDKVTTTSSTGEQECLPLYGLNHKQLDTASGVFWLASRRPATMNTVTRDEATDVFLSLVDLHFNPDLPEGRTLIVDTLCSNRNLPEKLPYSSTQPKLQCVDIAPPCVNIRCLTQPSATVRPALGNHARWRLISHLNLNHLSLAGGESATKALKEILRLYDFKESSVTRSLIDAIVSVQIKSISAPLTIDGHAAMCRGSEIEIILDDRQLTGSSAYLFASILEHFFALYCSINSFTRVLVKLKNREGYLKKCPPRAGEKIFL
ncbi:MAG: type VI secretion system baseplate subunit TssF, partial [Pseudomonadota bacterium]|nr:type VI secretion system baseplate subunit TssF [Pseudomonadota bacterium]